MPVLADLYLQDGRKSADPYMHYISQGLHITALNLGLSANISNSGMASVARMTTLASLNLCS